MKSIPLTRAKDALSSVIRQAEDEEILITRHGRPAAVVVGFRDEDAWLEYRLLNDEGFLKTIERAREDIAAGHFALLDDVSK